MNPEVLLAVALWIVFGALIGLVVWSYRACRPPKECLDQTPLDVLGLPRLEESHGQIQEGWRRRALFRAGIHLKSLGWTEDMIAPGLAELNERHNKPPLPAEAVLRVAASVVATRYLYEIRARGVLVRPPQEEVQH